jgi:DHA1 family bicyclomycin/chloramphenicol resistance-like MFS transporter
METLWTFVALQALSLVCIGLCGANFGAMAMAAVGHVAGTASSIQGFITTLVAAAIGSAIGQSYDGTTLPLAGGYLCIGLGAITLIWFVEGGRLFRSRLVRD